MTKLADIKIMKKLASHSGQRCSELGCLAGLALWALRPSIRPLKTRWPTPTS